MAEEANKDPPTMEEIQSKRVVEIRTALTEVGLPTNGIKADLVKVRKSFAKLSPVPTQVGLR